MRYWVETLGCPKNQVDSEKLAGTLLADGYRPASDPGEADVLVINTCAFVEAARQESVDTILELAESRRPGSRLVVTGCMAQRYGDELASAMPEIDLVAGFGVPVSPGPLHPGSPLHPSGPLHPSDPLHPSGPLRPGSPVRVELRSKASTVAAGSPTRPASVPTRPAGVPSLDLLELARPPASAPWAYVKVAEGCDRRCGFCAIPSFRGRQRSRLLPDILAEVESLAVEEVVLVAQDLASYGRDIGRPGAIVQLVKAVAERCRRVRLLYLYPSSLSEELIDAIGETGCHYFDLSLQHVSRAHLRRMRRPGDGGHFAERVRSIRARYPDAAFRSSFIVGYPGETEEDHDQLLRFLGEVELDWAGFFAYSKEEGTYAAERDDQVDPVLVAERLAECSALQDPITARQRASLVSSAVRVLVDSAGIARSHREAPEIDGLVRVPRSLGVGRWFDVTVTASEGPDLVAVPVPETAA